ncbi:MAG: hypothetical protein ABIH34_02535, partial [Nanoarchaeota archaeon]
MTIFIILGLIILAAVGLLLFLRGDTGDVAQEVTEDTPQRLMPVRILVEQCMDQIAKDGVSLAMSQGGFIDTIYLPITNPLDPTENRALAVAEGHTVPYWFYNARPNEELFTDMRQGMPRLCRDYERCPPNQVQAPSIEEQLDNYIEDNLDSCIDNFESLLPMRVVAEGEYKLITAIRPDNTIYVFLDYPIEITDVDQKTNLRQFAAEFPSGMYELYHVAKEITDHEIDNCFIEMTVKDMIVAGSGIDQPIPPPGPIEDGGNPRFWIYHNVKERLSLMLTTHIRFLSARNASNIAPTIYCEDDFCRNRQAYYDQIRALSPSLHEFHDVHVRFHYLPQWGLFLDMPQREGQLIKPYSTTCQGGGFPSSFFCNLVNRFIPTTYEFDYMLSFPVLTELVRQNEDGREERFNFALETNLRGNQCYKAGLAVEEQYIPGSDLCDTANRMDNPITITIKNQTSGNEPISDAHISFQMGPGVSACTIGYTNEDGVLTESLPEAVRGFLLINHPDYLGKYVDLHEFSEGTITLLPFINKKVDVRIIDYLDKDKLGTDGEGNYIHTGWVARRNELAEPLKEGDMVTVQLTRIREDPTEQDLVAFSMLEYGQETINDVRLVPGKYQVEVILLKELPGHSLEQEKDRVCVDDSVFWGCSKKPRDSGCGVNGDYSFRGENTCYRAGYKCDGNGCADTDDIIYPEINLTVFLNGGLVFDEDSGYWQTPPEYASFEHGD